MAFGKIVSSFTTPLSGRTNRRHFKSRCGDSTVGGPEPREWLLLWLYGMSVGVVVSEDPHLPGGGRFGTTMTRGRQVGGHELGMDRRYGQVMGEGREAAASPHPSCRLPLQSKGHTHRSKSIKFVSTLANSKYVCSLSNRK